jgi:hypothetical protein
MATSGRRSVGLNRALPQCLAKAEPLVEEEEGSGREDVDGKVWDRFHLRSEAGE